MKQTSISHIFASTSHNSKKVFDNLIEEKGYAFRCFDMMSEIPYMHNTEKLQNISKHIEGNKNHL